VVHVFIFGEIRVYREGFAAILSKAGLDVVGTGDDLDGTSVTIAATAPDVVLADIAGRDGVLALRRLSSAAHGVPIVAFGLYGEAEEVVACAEAGAAGYVTRDQSHRELIGVLETVSRGETLCSPRIAAALMRRVSLLATNGSRTADVKLTRRELEIAELVEEGLSNKEIAHRLVIEVATVKSHVHNILEKLQVRRRSDAAAWLRARRAPWHSETTPTHELYAR
jgi:two-component system nitrate/nitrite response regulator NarL